MVQAHFFKKLPFGTFNSKMVTKQKKKKNFLPLPPSPPPPPLCPNPVLKKRDSQKLHVATGITQFL